MGRYKTARALEMAVRSAAQKSSMDTSAAITGFYFHRLLVRIFYDQGSPFVLKGGHGMLARTTDARRTRDIDISTDALDIDAALEELTRLASRDMDDFITFEVVGHAPIKARDRYRDGYSVQIAVSLGGRAMQPISIDLMSDEVECGEPDYVTPADRLEVEGLPVCDYPVFPVAKAIADKFCGIVERHDGRSSSRVKDLVDLAVYATHEQVDGGELVAALGREAALRRLVMPVAFSLPDGWAGSYEEPYRKLFRQTALDDGYRTMAEAASLAARLLDPALDGSCAGKSWNPERLEWAEA